MSATGRLINEFKSLPKRRPFRLLGASGQLGYGIPTPAFNAGLARKPDLIGCDMGSIDIGPYYLGSGNMATAVTAKLWFFIFAFDGIANTLFNTDILWTGSQGPAQAAIIIADVWKTTPFMALLILAGLQMIPAEVYEAAKVDGASTWQRFRLITLPLVKPALMVAILFRVLDALRMYDLPAIMTGGANGTTTLSILVVNQIRVGFNSAAALSTITFLIIFIVAFIFVRFLGANAVESASGGAKGKMK